MPYGSFFGGGNNSGNYYDYDDDKEFKELIVKGAKKTHSRLFGALALFSILSTVLTVVCKHILKRFFKQAYAFLFQTSLGNSILNLTILYVICLPVFYLIVRKMETRSLPKRRIGAKEFIGLLAISQLLMLVGNYIGIFFNSMIGSIIGKTVTNTTANYIQTTSIPNMLVFSVIIVPIAEEFLMRKLVIDRLAKYGSGFALVVSAVTFGAFHENFYQFFYATFIGFILGYLYIRGGLKYSIALHIIMNFINSILATLYTDASLEILRAQDPTQVSAASSLIVLFYTFLIYGLLFYGAVLLFGKFRRGELTLRHFDDARIKLPSDSVGRSLFSNFGMIVFIIISVLGLIKSILI